MGVYVVTGGTGDIGRATVARLARQGDLPVIAGRDLGRASEVAAAIDGAAAVQMEIADAGDCERAIADVVERFGAIDGIVCSAATFAFGPALELTARDLLAMLEVNVAGTLLPCQAAARAMIEANRPGSVVVVSSSAANRAVGAPAYGASKGAVESLARELALEWAPHGIRVNIVSPGLIDSVMSGPAIADEEIFGRFMAHTPLGRPGTPNEVAALIAFLLGDSASYVTAALMPADGGYLSR